MEYKIKQIRKELVSTGTYLFSSYNYAKNHFFDLRDYEVVYEGNIEAENPNEKVSIEDYLEHLFYVFNMERPNDFKGHSLSVSDIIELNGKNYYCDNAGWVEIGEEIVF